MLRRAWLRRTMLAGAAIVILAFGFAAFCSWLVTTHGARVVATASAAPPVDVVIVPGAKVYRGDRPSGVLRARLECALQAWQAGKAKYILVSGDHNSPGYDELNAMRDWLRAHKVPSEIIFMDHAGLRTHDTMQRAARVFGVRQALVCTQSEHMARTLYLARHAGIAVTGIAADHVTFGRRKAWLRERAASVLAVLDVLVNRQPKYLGPPIPLTSSATATHDAWTTP